jgi:prepilin-type processing-associated H-X9-DG protein
MKQLGLSFIQYVQDYDEQFPAGRSYAPWGGYPWYTAGWAGQVWPYVKSKPVFACPDDPSVAVDGAGNRLPAFQIISYGMNDALMGDQNGGTGAALAALNAPSLTVLLCETQNNWVDPSNYASDLQSPGATCDTDFWSGKPSPGGANDKYATGALPGQNIVTLNPGRHTGGANYLAADGHVKFLMGSRVSGGKDAANNDPSQPQTPMGGLCNRNANCAAGTSSMNNGGGANSAVLTFSKI